jgi:hypothetical protein
MTESGLGSVPSGDPDARDAQPNPEVQREAGSPRVIAAGGVHHEEIR